MAVQFSTQQIKFTTSKKPDGTEQTTFTIDTEDIIAIGCVIIALLVLIGVIMGKIPLKPGLAAIAAFTSGSVISEVIKAKRKKNEEFRDGSHG
ncbi:MAG: hypothetical protein A2Z72_03350 [Omnitrophica bacterium RBG_13_46_9]|nr:MAG: hypothetical protein A2Z72_03350 [Omnitrophica bacterium RBG_13_46_9]